jgi:hypothetical protein
LKKRRDRAVVVADPRDRETDRLAVCAGSAAFAELELGSVREVGHVEALPHHLHEPWVAGEHVLEPRTGTGNRADSQDLAAGLVDHHDATARVDRENPAPHALDQAREEAGLVERALPSPDARLGDRGGVAVAHDDVVTCHRGSPSARGVPPHLEVRRARGRGLDERRQPGTADDLRITRRIRMRGAI